MSSERPRESVAQLFPGLLGLWLALAPIKFGTPVILDHQVGTPGSWLEIIFQPWPVVWGHALFIAVFTCGCLLWKWRSIAPRAVLLLPAAWFAWQLISAGQTVRPDLTHPTLVHFGVCAAAFYLGFFVVGGLSYWRTLWLGLAAGWLVVVLIGWKQHFGGLEEMREYFYSLPNWREQPPELIAKIASNRIFSTLFYPNALAGALILVTPAVTAIVWCALRDAATPLRLIASATTVFGAGGCLYWSGSKAGWLIALGQTVAALGGIIALGSRRNDPGAPATSGARSPGPANAGAGAGRRTAQTWLVILVLVVAIGGAAGFWLRYRHYFAKGATSVAARFDYWAVAASNAVAQPVLGSGPGTFLEVYRRGKPPQAEMARLTHNDYLQQATDSGIPSALLFLALVGSALWLGAPFGRNGMGHPIACGVWLGIAGIAVQSIIEFGLYIPAIAWPWFLAMGGLLKSRTGR